MLVNEKMNHTEPCLTTATTHNNETTVKNVGRPKKGRPEFTSFDTMARKAVARRARVTAPEDGAI